MKVKASYHQERLWRTGLPAASYYNIPLILEIEGDLDIQLLEKGLGVVVNRHESLRTRIVPGEDELYQSVEPETEIKLRVTEVETGNNTQIESLAIEEAETPFSMDGGPLIRAALFQLSTHRYVLVVTFHHLIADRRSLEIIANELFHCYNAMREGSEPRLPEIPLFYADFSLWQRELPQDFLEPQIFYWKRQLAQAGPLELPSTNRRSPVPVFQGQTISFQLSAELSSKIREFCRARGAGCEVLLLAAFNILLSRYCGQEDILVGTALDNRHQPGTEDIVGPAANLLMLRSSVPATIPLNSYFNELTLLLEQAYDNRDIPYEQLLLELFPGEESRETLFNVLFQYRETSLRIPPVQNLGIRHIETNIGYGNYHLNFLIIPEEESFKGVIAFNREYYRESFVSQIIENYSMLLESILRESDGPGTQISRLDIFSTKERNRYLVEWNQVYPSFPADKTIHRLFEEKVKEAPENIAISAEFGQRDISYRQLDELSNRLAHYLADRYIRDNQLVGIMVDRSPEMLIGILAILKLGCGYVPLNSKLPPERIKYILDECTSSVVLTQSRFREDVAGLGDFNCICIDEYDNYQSMPATVPVGFDRENPGNVAYVIFTSGSTGNPKGVPITHSNLSPLLHWGYHQLGLSPSDRVIHNLSYYFDWAVWELFIALTSGSCLNIVSDDVLLDAEACAEYIHKQRVTALHVTPTQYKYLVQTGRSLDTLKYLFIGAEKLTLDLVRRSLELVRGDCRVFNMYGPTECTIISSVLEIERSTLDDYERLFSVPIGPPVANAKYFILDKHFNLCPPMVTGELYIAGDGVASGYLNDPVKSSNAFIDLSSRLPGACCRMPVYKTGDLARWLPDGTVEFLGRIDHQVKIRGYRIELGEIESRLIKHDEVREAVALVNEDETGDKYICAYIVSGKTPDMAGIKQYLAQHLPGYMVPSYFVPIDNIPLNPNGKINRDALPDPRGAQVKKDRVLPRNPVERTLAEIWSEVLDISEENIGIDDDFFELGGHSLKATVLLAKIHQRLDVRIPLAELFELTTIGTLAERIGGSDEDKYAAIQVVESREYYQLSPAQKRMFIIMQMVPETTTYNMPQITPFAFHKEKDSQRLSDALNKLVQRHESLRTSFEIINGEPVQKIHDTVDYSIRFEQVADAAGVETVLRDFIKSFDLSMPPLWRFGVVDVGGYDQLLMFDMHHIISDGISNNILVRDFAALYDGQPLPELRIQYKDFAQWMHTPEMKESVARQESYWLTEFAGEIPILNLPYDFRRPAVQSFEGSSLEFEIPLEDTHRLEEIASAQGATLFMILLAALNVFFSKLSGQEDIIIGSPVGGRRHVDLENIIGMFVNTLVLRNLPNGDKSFNAFLEEVREKTLKAFECQEYPIEELVEKIGVNRDAGRNPLFDVVFALQMMDEAEPTPNGRETGGDLYNFDSNTAKFDFTVASARIGDRLTVLFQYSTKLFKKETIRRFIVYFRNVVSSIVENPAVSLGQIEIIPEKEKQELLYDFNDTGEKHPLDKTIHELFREQVELNPGNIALMAGEPLTYRQLDVVTDHLAHRLIRMGTTENHLVGLLADRSAEMIIGMLGILKAGGAYVPLNPKAPGARNKYIMEECTARLLVTTRDIWENGNGAHFENWDGESVFVEDFSSQPATRPRRGTSVPQPATRNSQPVSTLAYVIFTSGSTGTPKGVPISHANLSPLLHWGYRDLGLGSKDRVLQNLSYYFDWSVWEIFITLTSGAGLYIVSDEVLLDPQLCARYISEHAVTALHITPTQYQYLVQTGHPLNTLKYLFIGAEKLTLDLVRRSLQLVNPRCRVFNMYGPTESTIITSVLEIDRDNLDPYEHLTSVPIGPPVANCTYYVLDKYFKLCPPMVIGELYIGGDGLASGYLNDPGKSASAFVDISSQSTDADCPIPIYKTGDLARWLPDGTVEYLGRIDHQVKIRGYRIELGEIENQLLENENLHEAVVIVRQDSTDDKYLCAYIVPGENANNDALTPGELKKHLSQSLPDYMVPSYFVLMDQLPLNPNKKIDRKALPEPERTGDGEISTPRTEAERQLAGIWADVLGIPEESIDIDGNFFQLGGHSLKATVMLSRFHKELGVKVPLVEIFTHPTIREMAGYIEGLTREQFVSIPPAETKDFYNVSSAQRRLYVLQQMEPLNTVYNMPLVVPMDVAPDTGKLREVFLRLIRRHESFRTAFTMMGETPVQQVLEIVDFGIQQIEINNESGTVERVLEEFVRPFDLSCAPLLRVGLLRVIGKEDLLLVDMHHIISDGFSFGILMREFTSLYEGQDLPPLNIQYKDFAEWQSGAIGQDRQKQQERFWLEQFRGEIPLLNLPLDYPRPVIQSFEGDIVDFQLSAHDTAALKTAALENDTTLYMVLLTIFNILLSRLSGQDDIIIGTTIAGREHADLEKIIGMFVNTMALRNYPGREKTSVRFLREVTERTLEAFDNQEYPFEELVERVDVNRDTGRNPLFDVMFSLQNIFQGDNADSGQDQYQFDSHTAKFDLTLVGMESGDVLDLGFSYCTRLFKRETVERFVTYFKNTVSFFLENPGTELSRLEIATAQEKRMILEDFNRSGADYPREKTIHRLFQEQVDRTPHSIAVAGTDSDGHESLTYAQLNIKANQLARLLRREGVTNDSIVGLLVEPGVPMMVGIIAILKAGGAYLPIDPSIPAGRVEFILNDAAVRVLLSYNAEGETISYDGEQFRLDDQNLYRGDEENPSFAGDVGDLAYVIYTSGSTGRPKGVGVEHSQLVNFVYHMYNRYDRDIHSNDRCLSLTNIMFDVSVWEFFLSLVFGARLVILPKQKRFDVFALSAAVLDEEITLIYIPPALLKDVCEQLAKDRGRLKLNKMLVGVEPIRDHVLEGFVRLNPAMRIVNGYGPTETTICASSYNYTSRQPEGEIVPIGGPLSNNQIVLLDPSGHIVPPGIAGELCVSGDGVSRGYLNNPELTAGKYTQNPYFEGKRMYRTGDMARWLPDGSIRFLGRIDHQVKIRGYRIELGEIQGCLQKHESVRDSVVLLREDSGDKYICAYIVFNDNPHAASADEIREYLARYLPEYMIPSHFVTIEHIPLTPNGKVDRKALPAPEVNDQNEYTPPRDELERGLVRIWANVLGVSEDITGIDANFFHMGGHSLKATVLVSRIHREFNVKIPLVEVLTHPTVRELAEYMRTQEQVVFDSILPVEKRNHYPVTPAQKRVYILQQMEPNSVTYNMPLAVPLEEGTRFEKLESVFLRLIQRHESFRTSFHMIDGEPYQRIHDHVDFKAAFFEAGAGTVPGIIRDFVRPFKLSQAPLLRLGFVEIEGENDLLVIDMHHIITDGVSQSILRRELIALYNDQSLEPLPIQYKDFACWMTGEPQKSSVEKHRNFWLETFAGEIPLLNLPLDFPRPAVQSYEGETLSFEISSAETSALKAAALENGTTLYMVLLSVFYVLMSRLSGQEDIIVGTTAAGRRRPELENIIGMFVNTLALRNYPNGEKSFKEFLTGVTGRTLEAFENQEYPFEELVERVDVNRDTGRNPLFDVMFSLQNIFDDDGSDTMDLERFQYESKTVKFDLTLVGMETQRKLLLGFQYCTRLFKEKTIRRFITYFKRILSSVIRDSNLPLWRIEIISGEEKRKILYDINDTSFQYPTDATLHHLFEDQAGKTPEHTALILNDRTLNYSQLNKKANRMAHTLRDMGVRPGEIVGIFMERCVEMIVGILAVLKSGGGYVPIDVQYPADRINHILADSHTRLLLTLHSRPPDFPVEGEIIAVDEPGILHSDESNPAEINTPSDIAYIIYTSGSTGLPRGVTIQHSSVVNLAFYQKERFNITPSERILQFSSISFDASVEQIFIALFSGAALVLINRETLLDEDAFDAYVRKHQVTHIHAVPSFLKTIKPGPLPALKRMIAGGDVCPVSLAEQWYSQCDFYNEYGPTETTVTSIEFLVSHLSGQDVQLPIGKPLGNTTVYVLDRFGQPVPFGVPGELYIGGHGVARGYLNNSQMTRERFLENPFSHGGYYYRTGDLVRLMEDGNLQFLGRIDHQVKIRGYRIELGEIEAQLSKYHAVNEAIVLAVEDSAHEKYLCAYVVPAPSGDSTPAGMNTGELKEFLSRTLPEYMIPAYFVPIPKIPLTPNGKLDRKALPNPGINNKRERIAPGNGIEIQLAEIWSEILGIQIPEISIDDDFFRVGGHSLKATAMVSRIRETFNTMVPLIEVFKRTTIQSLAEFISQGAGVIQTVGDERLVLLKPGKDEGANLFLIHDGSGEVEGYMAFCENLSLPLNCWGLRADSLENLAPAIRTIPEIAAGYVQKIQRLQPQGPYRLAGWSLGGSIAFEMALQLEKSGFHVDFLSLIDSPGPVFVSGEETGDFTLQSQLEWVWQYLPDDRIKEKLEKINHINHLWPTIVNHLEENNIGVDLVKQLIPGNLARMIPNYHLLGTRELLYYLNLNRTLVRARANYTPSGQTNTPLHYIRAGQSPAEMAESWQQYCRMPVNFIHVPGDHVSIMEQDKVGGVVEIFGEKLQRKTSTIYKT